MANGHNKDFRTKLNRWLNNIIKPVVVLLQPLSVSSLAGLLHVKTGDIAGAFKDLRSVLQVPADQHSTVRLLHPSFRDFLLDPRRCNDPRFVIDERHAHYDLFVHCFQVMLARLKQYMCGLRNPGVESKQLGKEALKKYIPSHVQYACRH